MTAIVQGIAIELSLDLSKLDKGLAVLKKTGDAAAKSLSTSFSSTNRKLGQVALNLRNNIVPAMLLLKTQGDRTAKSLQKTFEKANKSLDKVGTKSRKAAGGLGSMGRQVSAFNTKALGLGAIVITLGLLAKKAILAADGLNRMKIRINSIIGDQTKLVAIQERLFRIAQRTGQPLQATLSLFQKFSLARETLKATDDQILQLTENVLILGVQGGSAADQLKFATLQLTQALSNGKVQAQELNSILEGAPLIAREIERGLGMIPGALRKAVLAGDVSSREVFVALLQRSQELREEISEIPVDLDRATSQLSNAVLKIIENFEKATGLVASLAQGISNLGLSIFPDEVQQVKNDLNDVNDEMLTLGKRLALLKSTKIEKGDEGSFFGFAKGELTERINKIIAELARLRTVKVKILKESVAVFKKAASEIATAGPIIKPDDIVKPTAIDKAIEKLKTQLAVLKTVGAGEKIAVGLGVDIGDARFGQIVKLVNKLGDLNSEQKTQNDLLKEAQRIVADNLTDDEKKLSIMEKRATLLPIITELIGDQARAEEILANSFLEKTDKIKTVQKEMITLAEAFGNAAESSFERAIFSGKKLSGILTALASDFAKLFLRQAILKPFVAGLTGKLFPGLATGGGLQPGVPTIVGEKGPELISSRSPARVTPAGQTRNMMNGASGNTIIEQHNTFAVDVAATVRAEVLNLAPLLIDASRAAVFAAQGGVRG